MNLIAYITSRQKTVIFLTVRLTFVLKVKLPRNMEKNTIVCLILYLMVDTVIGVPYPQDVQKTTVPDLLEVFLKFQERIVTSSGLIMRSEVLNQKPIEAIHFYLYDRARKKNSYKEIIFRNETSFNQIRMRKAPRLKMYIHGFRSGFNHTRSQLLKDAILETYPGWPLILVEWNKMAQANHILYSAVAENNAPKVSLHVTKFISDLIRYKVISSPDQVHLIGHSLGGQICGQVGQMIKDLHNGQKIGRITALDPAGVNFWDAPLKKRLDESDASFVDCVFTSEAISYFRKAGHANFWSNLNEDQPGDCDTFLKTACNHQKAIDLYVKSLKDTTMYGCRITLDGRCSKDCYEDVVFGEHISEEVEGEFCFSPQVL